MGMSRKRKRELKRLKRSASDVWGEQRETLEHAAAVLRDVRRQAGHYARDEVAPTIKHGYDSRVRPVVRSARGRISDDVIPSVSSRLGSALAMLDAAKDPRVRDVVKRASQANQDWSTKASRAVAPPKKKSHGPGSYILIGLGVVAAAGVAYAAWQTLRADDDLWIEDVGDTDLGPESAPTV